ncbi:hypothetical protein [Flavobacterium rhizosphaerae]|uniref:Uncharacterized protein n=1 Tax=Flavobacterium rhizosphaerae TaxID=3163298 RepID=A0ABW8YYR2_9FLAO
MAMPRSRTVGFFVILAPTNPISMRSLFFLLLTISFNAFGQDGEFNGFLSKKDDGTYLFYEISNDSLLSPRLVSFVEMDTIGLQKKAYSYFTPRFKDERHISVIGKKENKISYYNDLPYYKILITRVSAYEYYNFYKKNKTRINTYSQDSIYEGFYVNEFEGQAFHVLKPNGKLEKVTGCASFQKREIKDSLLNINFPRFRAIANKGIKLKVKGYREYGDMYGYGHYGMDDYEIHIDKIIEIDTLINFHKQLNKELEKGYVINKDTAYLPVDFIINKEYKFISKEGKMHIELYLKKTSTSEIDYKFVLYKKKKIVLSKNGNLLLNPISYISAYISNKEYSTNLLYEYIDELYNDNRNTFDRWSQNKLLIPFNEVTSEFSFKIKYDYKDLKFTFFLLND